MDTQPFSQARILIVDDTPVNVHLLESILDEAGYTELHGLTDPRQVEPLLRNEPAPDLVLLDIRMPYLSGYEVLELIGQTLGESAPPVVVLTAQTDAETRSKALAMGALDFITKPFDQHEVLQRIHNILAVHSRSMERRNRSLELEAMVAERTAELQAQSLQEPVTGLPNRRALLMQATEWLKQAQPLAGYFIVADGLDDIARLHGYTIAETLATQLGQLFSRSPLAGKGMLGCWGNHEFVFLLPQPAGQEADAALLLRTAERIARLLSGEHEVDDMRLSLTVRIGISHSSRDSTAQELIRQAALALPKEGSSLTCQLYSADMTRQLERRSQLLQQLRLAIQQQELHLVYQPKVDLQTGQLLGAEALMRWQNPLLGAISPLEFIPLAETTGLILPMGEWLLDESMQQLSQWRTQGIIDDSFVLAINLSGSQLMQEGFAEQLLSRCLHWSIPPQMIQVEITESTLMIDIHKAIDQLNRLSEVGISAAIDDFGTGYSSLAYLRQLPVQVLKIDRSFVTGIENNVEDRRLAETITTLAHNLGCQVVAEGVETESQARLLHHLKCEQGQGYYFSRPLSVADFEHYTRAWPHDPADHS
ncbi:GGDEF domain-containing response regulator [Pokkaliibacter plantistimulans]|uniref:GGDEF domain-containing response regulator n=1 Tax=Proteobacteria bacterium 228 TaxID=2083153 RepID=A0A2S5KML4_9PROT|nr:EAL domain-containing protein [Pokkaliibacter plantistimulans]PPC76038.1 GGDEF domain-containing response regulator [Pokkaliibacter plantistimulans]